MVGTRYDRDDSEYCAARSIDTTSAAVAAIAADGAAVLTERTDALIFGPLRLQFWICGVFEVHNGRITLWRDYFDLFDMFKATVRGLAGLVVPSLRATF